MLLRITPEGFSPSYEVCCSLLESWRKIFLIQRSEGRENACQWELPYAILNPGEKTVNCAMRGLAVGAGVKVQRSELDYFGRYSVERDRVNYSLHLFHADMSTLPRIKLDKNYYKEKQWVLPSDAIHLPLAPEISDLIRIHYRLP